MIIFARRGIKHAEFAELYEARSDEKFVSDRFCDFSVFCVK